MKHLTFRLGGLLLLSVMMVACAVKQQPAIAPDKDIEKNVEALLQKMTLEEKIGQMTQLTIDLIGRMDMQGNFQFNDAQIDTIFRVYKVGSILNVPSKTPTPAEWHTIIGRLQEESMEHIGIPCLYGLDQIHGTTYTLGGVFFPQGINMAASFNRELVRRGAEICAYETRAASVPWTFAPVLDLARDARWPRHWENYGEDAYVNAEMGREAVLGFQGDDPNHIDQQHIAACIKHYMGYGSPVSGKDRTPSSISERDMREKHFAPFLETARAGALTLMVNSANNNGMPFHASHKYLTEWLKEDLQWDGMIVTDWADINNLYTRDHVAASTKEAIRMAINAGIDMSMVPYSWDFCDLLKELVEEGQVSMDRIDDAVRRVLRLKYRLGLFDKPLQDPADYPEFGSEQHAQAALASAKETMVLLKNEADILPLSPNTKILLTGPNANSMRSLNGGWSYTWQGSNTDVYTEPFHTIREAFEATFGAGNVVYEPGVLYKEKGAMPWLTPAYWEEEEPQIAKAVAAAARVDVIVACIGENSYCETPGNLEELDLSANQQALVKALAATGKPVVLVLNEGRPRIVREIEPLAKAIVDIMLPGNYGGDALASLITGQDNFSGKLPFTYPKHSASLVTYDYKPGEEMDTMQGAYDYNAVVSVQWPFGYGLSYTTFQYANLKVDKEHFTVSDVLTFSVDVTNTGSVDGKESVLLFSRDLVATLSPDVRRLRNFTKVSLAAGQTTTVTLQVPAQDLAFVDYEGHWILEQGAFRIQVGDQTVNVVCDQTYAWDTPNRE